MTCQPQSSRHIGPSKSESKSWQCWDDFDMTEVNRPWILKKKTYGRRSIARFVVQYWTRKLDSHEVGRLLIQRDRAIW
ncbi:hypothetical protein V1519DRAFT_120430 [Lipomyces tetrasporus]